MRKRALSAERKESQSMSEALRIVDVQLLRNSIPSSLPLPSLTTPVQSSPPPPPTHTPTGEQRIRNWNNKQRVNFSRNFSSRDIYTPLLLTATPRVGDCTRGWGIQPPRLVATSPSAIPRGMLLKISTFYSSVSWKVARERFSGETHAYVCMVLATSATFRCSGLVRKNGSLLFEICIVLYLNFGSFVAVWNLYLNFYIEWNSSFAARYLIIWYKLSRINYSIYYNIL